MAYCNSTLLLGVLILTIISSNGCNDAKVEGDHPGDKANDINFVKEKYEGGWMKIPGVVGTYVGETDDKTPCIKVMVEAETEQIKRQIPSLVEGHSVIIEVTGKIKPM